MKIRKENTASAADTIYSIATGVGRSAVAVVRVSGPSCSQILRTLCPRYCFVERRATLVRLVDREGELIDQAMVIYFAAPRSFTGEDIVEFQVAGSRAVLAALLRALSTFPATRPAEAGEFTRRSFENGKRDLAEVEGLAAVVEAETSTQLRNAQRAASGELSRECETIRANLLNAMALIETLLDFSDVEDVDNTLLGDVFASVSEAHGRIAVILNSSANFEQLRDGLFVVIAGPPNAGKSSLMNLLVRRDVSIVSSTPGTTRDLVEIPVEIAGYPITFVDTAGIRDPSDAIEAEGIARALDRRKAADLTLWLTSCEEPDTQEFSGSQNVLKVRTKGDLALDRNIPTDDLVISSKTGEGIDALLAKITEFADMQLSRTATSLITTQRQRAAIIEADASINRYIQSHNAALEVRAEDLRLAARCMSRVVGRIDVEEVLGSIFSRLCVGK